MQGRGDARRIKLRQDFVAVLQALDSRDPARLLPLIPGAERGYQAIGQPIVAYTGASIIKGELALGSPLVGILLIAGYEALYFDMQFARSKKMQPDIQL